MIFFSKSEPEVLARNLARFTEQMKVNIRENARMTAKNGLA